MLLISAATVHLVKTMTLKLINQKAGKSRCLQMTGAQKSEGGVDGHSSVEKSS